MEKLKQLPIYWQLILLVGVAALLGYGFRMFVTDSIYTEAATVKEQADALQSRNEQARIATQRIEEFRQLYTAKMAEYDELKVLLPEEREITNVLQGLQDTARQSNLTMLRFTPRDDKQEGFITAKPVEIEVSSNFANLRAFYERIAKMPRIVSISDFKINQRQKQASDKTLDSQFLLTAYYATPESAKQQPTKPGVPANPAAPNSNPATPATNPAAPIKPSL